MTRRTILLVALFAGACDREPTAAARPESPVALSAHEQPQYEGPPTTYPDFESDSYVIGNNTGAGTTTPGLKCATTSQGRVCEGFLASAVDGTLLDVRVAVPHGPAHPLVVLIHGWGGSKSSSGDIADALFADGYAVLRYSTRGFGRSWGYVNLADRHAELADLRSIVGQVVDWPGLTIDADAVAVTGASYGGGHSWLSLLEPTFASPRGAAVRIRTVVPIASWTDLVTSLVPNGEWRPWIGPAGGPKLSYTNALFVGGSREPTADRPYFNYPPYLVEWQSHLNLAEPNADDATYHRIASGLGGYRSIWWQKEFWDVALSPRIPVFQVQGLTDDLFPATEAVRMLLALKHLDPTYPIASYFGDLGHPRARNKPAEVDYVLGLIRGWLAWYLKGEGAQPAHVVHAAITRPNESFTAGDVLTVGSWHELASRTLTHEFEGSGTLANPAFDPLGTFFWDPLVMEGAHQLKPLPVAPASAEVATSLSGYAVDVSALDGASPLLIAGQPSVTLRATTRAHRVQLNVRFFDAASADGRDKRLITRGTRTLDSGSPLVALGTVEVAIPTYGNLWELAADRVLLVEISNVDSPYIAPSKVPSTTEISEVKVVIPVYDR
jgi:pimeloyl-ACP methyl ester carboxylesterase